MEYYSSELNNVQRMHISIDNKEYGAMQHLTRNSQPTITIFSFLLFVEKRIRGKNQKVMKGRPYTYCTCKDKRSINNEMKGNDLKKDEGVKNRGKMFASSRCKTTPTFVF